MTDRRVTVSTEHRPGLGYRPTFNGQGVGPWMDRNSARFLAEWFSLTRDDAVAVALKHSIARRLEEAIGLATEAIALPAIPEPEADHHRSISARPRRGSLAAKVAKGVHRG